MNAQQTQLEGQPPMAPPETALPPTPPVVPGAVPAAASRRYSPGLAVVLSFFPGLGHLYLGLYQRGIAFFLAFAAAIFLANHSDLGVIVAFVWFFALIDAYRQAQALNAGLVPEPITGATRPKAHQGSLGLGVFLAVIGVILLYNQFYPIDFTFLYTWWPLILVAFGIYLVIKHILDQKKQRDTSSLDPEP